MRSVKMNCDDIDLVFTITVDGGEIIVEDVDFADKDTVMNEPDFIESIEDELYTGDI